MPPARRPPAWLAEPTADIRCLAAAWSVERHGMSAQLIGDSARQRDVDDLVAAGPGRRLIFGVQESALAIGGVHQLTLAVKQIGQRFAPIALRLACAH